MSLLHLVFSARPLDSSFASAGVVCVKDDDEEEETRSIASMMQHWFAYFGHEDRTPPILPTTPGKQSRAKQCKAQPRKTQYSKAKQTEA